MASSLLLATLCAPIKEIEVTDLEGLQAERYLEMATLLSLTNVPIFPKREQLIEELAAKNIPNLVLPELKDFFSLMEKKFNPLGFCAAVKPKLDFIASHPTLKQYAKPLEKLMFVRLLQQVSEVLFHLITFSYLVSLISSKSASLPNWCILPSFMKLNPWL